MLRRRRDPTSILHLMLLLTLAMAACGRPDPPHDVAPTDGPRARSTERDSITDDAEVQKAAIEALGDREGTVLVMDPQTGRLKAAVNPRLAFEQAFPPGSTIKSFTALLALEAGLIDEETRQMCRGTLKRDDFQSVCSHPKSNSPFNVVQALAYSCNVFFADLSARLSPAAFRASLSSFGFGIVTGVNAGNEAAGNLSKDQWDIRDGVGEGGAVLATPIQLLTAYCTLFNGGRLLRPQIGPGFNKPDERARVSIDEHHRATLVKGCRGVVESGTASDSKLDSLPVFVFGKTGTAAASNQFRRYGWFVCFAADPTHLSAGVPPPDSLKLAVLVFLKRGHGWEAAGVAKDFLQRIYKGGESSRSASAVPDFTASPMYVSGEQPPVSSQQSIRVRVLREKRTLSISLEDYVLGVLSAEATIEDEPEALKAQAIISRTYALKNLNRHASEGYDLCSNTHCQQFVVRAPDEIREAVRRAVSDTAGRVLVDSSSRLVDAYFHAACGGMTADIGALWGVAAPAYLRGVRDDYCSTGPHRNWVDRISHDQLLRAFQSDPRTRVGHRFEDLVVTKRDSTGRVERLRIEGDMSRELRGWDFKLLVGRVLGWNLIKSTRFNVSHAGQVFVFRGSGFGHGLGLCQEGAHVMARRGSDHRKILEFYFPTTSVTSVATLRAALNAGDAQSTSPADQAFRFMTTRYAPVSAPQGARASGSSFRSLSSEHFAVRFGASTSQADVESTLRVLEGARSEMALRLNRATIALPDHDIEVVIYSTTAAFVSASGQPWFTAGATHKNRIQLQPLAVLKRRRVLATTLRHEFAHSTIESISGGRCPRWLAEGLAIHFAGEGRLYPARAGSSSLSDAELERRLASAPSSGSEMRSMYGDAYSRVMNVIKSKSETGIWRLVAAYGNGRSAAAASKSGRQPEAETPQSVMRSRVRPPALLAWTAHSWPPDSKN